jgi:hypothetical protein
MKQATYKTKCNKCDNNVYYYPIKINVTKKVNDEYQLNTDKRVVTLKCDDNHQSDYVFPLVFAKV